MAFASDPFVAFDTFVSRRLRSEETVDEYLGDLQDLARLIEENTSDRWLSCAFVLELPGPVRRQLREPSRIEHVTLEQILARVRVLMTEEVDEPVSAAAWRCRVLSRVPVGLPSTPTNRTQSQCSATSVEVLIILPETVGSPGANHGERSRRYAVISASNKDISREAGTTLSPHKLEMLPVMKVKVNGMDRIALVDSGCSSSVVSGMLCRPEVWKSTAILTAGRKCLLSHCVGSITLTVTKRNPLKTNVLVVNSKPLGFDLLLGMDVIKKLGGVHIDEGGRAHFAEAAHTLGATIELEQPDFRAELDRRTKSWTVSWKWSGVQPPERLYNRVLEYTIPARARAEYDKELQNWIDNGWLVPYPEDKLGPQKVPDSINGSHPIE